MAKGSNKRVHWDIYRAHKQDTLKALRQPAGPIESPYYKPALGKVTQSPSGATSGASGKIISACHHLRMAAGWSPTGSRRTKFLVTNLNQSLLMRTKFSVDRLFSSNLPQIGSLVVAQKERLLSGLDVSKATGPDAIPCRLQKVCLMNSPQSCVLFCRRAWTLESYHPTGWKLT